MKKIIEKVNVVVFISIVVFFLFIIVSKKGFSANILGGEFERVKISRYSDEVVECRIVREDNGRIGIPIGISCIKK